VPANRGATRAEQRDFEQLSLGREAGKLPGPSCASERACKPQLLLHQSRPRYTMLDWHPSAQITQARLEPRVTASALEMWHCGACCHVSSGSGTSFNRCARASQREVPSAGAGATRCAVLGPDQLSTTTKRVVALKTCAASKLFRCSGVCSHGGKRLGARPARRAAAPASR
jgi:hypothetical protein